MKLKGRVVLDRVWLAAMRAAPKIVENELRRGLRRATRAVRDRVRAAAPVGKEARPGHKPGTLKKSIRHKISWLKGTVYSHRTAFYYAPIRNWGGVIKARLRRFKRIKLPEGHSSGAKSKRVALAKPMQLMRFQVGGRWVSAKEVRQEGTQFFERGFEQAQGEIQAALDETGRRVAKRVFGAGGGV